VTPAPVLPNALPAAPAAPAGVNAMDWMKLPDHWPAQGDIITWCQNMTPAAATLLVMFGLVYLLFGWYIFKILVTLNAALVGAAIGALLGSKANSTGAGALIGGFVAAALTWPLMKWAVAIMGGLFGAVLGASLWRAFNLDPHFAWAGGLSGMILLGLLSFIIFRGSVIMYMSLQGAVMFITGALSLILKYPSIGKQIADSMSSKPFILPAAIFIPATIGLIFQQSQLGPAPAEKKK
jgi:hypothetical protein